MDYSQRSNNVLNVDSAFGSSAIRPDNLHRDDHFEELLFINNFSNDVHGAREGPDRRTKGSYVQRNIHRAKRMQATLRLSPKAPTDLQGRGQNYTLRVPPPNPHSSSQDRVIAPMQNSASAEPLPLFQPRVSQRQRRTSMLSEIRLPDKPADDEVVSFHSVGGKTQNEPHQVHHQEDSPMTLLDMGLIGTLDQLEVFRTSSPGSTKECFRYFLETFVPKVFPVFSIAREHCHWIFQAATGSHELLFAIAALSSATSFAARRRSNIEGSHSVRQRGSNYTVPTSDELWFKARAVRLLNIQIADPSSIQSETVLYTVMCLLLAAIVVGDQQEMKTHAFGLKKLIELRGHYDGLPVHAVAAIVSTLYVSCTIADIPPIPTPPTVVENGDIQSTFSAAFEAYPSLKEIGSGFADNSFAVCLSRSIGQACEEMRAFVTLREYLRRSQRTPTEFQSAYYHSKCLNCHFLATRSPFEGKTITNDREEPFRLAILIFWNANLQLNDTGSMLYRTLTTRLKASLENTDLETFWTEFCPILVWILLLGAFISRGQVEYSWFVAQMAKGISLSRTKDWQWIRAMLRRLFYLENIYQQSFKQSWKEACELAELPNTG